MIPPAQIIISIEEYNTLKTHSQMLGRIASVVSRFARRPTTTTYEAVVKLDARERALTKKLKNSQL